MLFLWVFLLFSVVYAQQDNIVNTTQGQVQGALATDGNYLVFYGVHYAGSTSGANRFKAPTPPAAYPGLFHAIDNSVICAHPGPQGLIGVEDCLVLNIHTKNLTVPKPVLVILLGEEYASTDSDTYSMKRLVENDILVVKINYRLSIFGFLCLGVPEAPGNAGLKDVIQGLKWIQDNIAKFGGDPNNVVLFGHGSGAAMVDLITLSPMSQGLVHKAITQSGSALAPWAVAYEPIRYAKVLAEKLSYTDKTIQELAQKLVSTDINLLSTVLQISIFPNNSAQFAPCIENKDLEGSFITQAPIHILRSGNYTHVPYLAGYTDREGTIRAGEAINDKWLQKMEANFTDFVQVDLSFQSIANKTAVAKEIKAYYFGTKPVDMDTIRDYLSYHGDTMILVSVIRGARERALTSRQEVRLLEFTYRGTKNSQWLYTQIPNDGVGHGGVLNYLFDFDLKPEDEGARTSLLQRYVSFANTGQPTKNGTVWFPYSAEASNYLLYTGDSLTSSVSLGEQDRVDPHSAIMTFWNNLLDLYYVPPVPVSSAANLYSFAFVLVVTQFVTRLL